MESFIHPLDMGSCQVLLPVIEKPAAPTVPSVPDYNPNPNHVTFS